MQTLIVQHWTFSNFLETRLWQPFPPSLCISRAATQSLLCFFSFCHWKEEKEKEKKRPELNWTELLPSQGRSSPPAWVIVLPEKLPLPPQQPGSATSVYLGFLPTKGDESRAKNAQIWQFQTLLCTLVYRDGIEEAFSKQVKSSYNPTLYSF